MMKQVITIIGFILLGFIPSIPAYALVDGQDYTCAPLAGLTAVSPYVNAVLERADNGITYAQEAGAATDFLSILPGWALSIGSAWAGLTDTTTQRTDSVRELRETSACLHFDLTLLDCTIEKVRTELKNQTDRGSWLAIIRLTSLLQFLNERKKQLTIGALDPQYPDPGWGYLQAFDRPGTVWCKSEASDSVCTQKSQEACDAEQGSAYLTEVTCTLRALQENPDVPATGSMCPFSADYAPAFDSGFGCDVETMDPRKAYPPVNAELESLNAVNAQLKSYRETAVEVQQLQEQIDELYGVQASSSSSSQSSRSHLNAYGCGWMGGWCDDDTTKRCTADEDCEDIAATCVFSDKVCEKNRAIRCTWDSQCDSGDKCIEANEPQLRSIRGNFSLDRDQLSILQSFLGLRSQQEISRVLREDLQWANELPESDPDAREERARQDSDPGWVILRTSLRQAVQAWSRVQARLESLIFPEAVDTALETDHALSDLHASISTLARQASAKDGLRDFVTRYASFLRISCIYRPCSMLLEQVIRLSTTQECFPYTNGEYLDDDENNPRWQKCKDAAGI